MSSTNTPVTQADVNEWARDIGKHANNVDGTLYYYVSKAKWDQVHDMLGRLLVERVELRRNYDAVAQAVGVAYEAEGHDAVGGPVDEVVAQASRNRDDAIIADEWQQRAKKLDADVDHFHKKWKDAETRAERAEANSCAAMLRRLKGELSALEKQRAADGWSGDAHGLSDAVEVVDRMLAEAEKPAEPVTQIGSIDDDAIAAGEAEAKAGETIPVEDLIEELKDREGDDVSALQCWSSNPCATCPRTEGGRPPYTTPAGVDRVCGRTACSAGFVCTLPEGHAGDHIAGDGRETIQRWPSEREGDDVLRQCREEIRRRCEDVGDKPFPPHYWFDAAFDELLRRALGEETR